MNSKVRLLYDIELSTRPIRVVSKSFGREEKATQNFRDDQSSPYTSEQLSNF